ncbi:MAG TPA: NADH-ubiquinone oxidoreductase-F iron-sulfur binding region domain-containing protein [Nitrospira sp.]|nr:NADH-ubiquinone oxidoreductase-F iron-sulfur binding region domain-containing protein [Nitrospira sp.]
MTNTTLYLSRDTSSRAVGAERLADLLRQRPDVRLVRTSSRGAFFLEPMIERDAPDGRTAWFNVTADDLPEIVEGRAGTPLHSIPFLAAQTRFTFSNFGTTQPLALDEYRRSGGFQGLEKAMGLTRDSIIEELKIAGLRGRGGAAFPVWSKWQAARRTDAPEKFVVVNADEGDAGTYCDRMVMEGDPFRLIEGMLICAHAIGATRGYVYCRQEYPAAAGTMRTAVRLAEEAGLLRLHDRPFAVDIVLGAGSYVCGEETALLESLEGRRGVVRVKPPYPAISGLYGQPTVVSNVLTLATVPNILVRGGAWHASLGTDRSRGTIALQIGGRVAQPGLIEIPFGMSLRSVLEQFGGGMAAGSRFKAVQVGGPLGSLFPESKLDISICYDAFSDAGAVLGHGGIVVYDEGTDMVELARHFMAFTADESCGKCTPCRIGSVRGRELLDLVRGGCATKAELALLTDLADTMRTASLCALGGRAPYPVLTAIEHFPREFQTRMNAEGKEAG